MDGKVLGRRVFNSNPMLETWKGFGIDDGVERRIVTGLPSISRSIWSIISLMGHSILTCL
jgi:hypothetical protein